MITIELLESRRMLSSSTPRLDPHFGVGGVVTSAVPSGDARQMLREPDGKILAAGYASGTDGLSAPFLARYLPNGRLDHTFGDDGRLYSPAGIGSINDTLLLPDQKIVVLNRGTLLRLLPNGQVDSSFGASGTLIVPSAGYPQVYWATVVALPDGHFLLAGTVYNSQSDTYGPDLIINLRPDGTLDPKFGGGDGVVTAEREVIPGPSQLLLRADGRFLLLGQTTEQFRSDGTPDPKFGQDGIIRFGSSISEPSSAVLTADGSMIVVGEDQGGTQTVVTRAKTHGDIDRTFGSNGFKQIKFPTPYSDPIGVDVAANGSIVIGEDLSTSVADPGELIGLVRLTPAGGYDPTFGHNGEVTMGLGVHQPQIESTLLQPDGKLIVGGSIFEGPEFLVRFASNGKLDTTFGNKGIETSDPNGQVVDLRATAVLPSGKILAVGGTPSLHTGTDIVVARFNSDGSNDTSFGKDGRVTVDLGGTEMATSLALCQDGKFVIADSDRPLLMRFNADGSIDKSFGHNGVVTNLPGAVNSIVVQRDGRILIGGAAPWLIARLNVDGSIDKTYGKAGISTLFADVAKPAGDETFFVNALLLQPDGKVVAGGGEQTDLESGTFLVLARCNSNGKVDRSFASNGGYYSHVSDEDDFIDPSFISNLALEGNGEILVTGISIETVVLKFKPNGSLDFDFGEGGFAQLDAYPTTIALKGNGKIVVLADNDGQDSVFQFTAKGESDSSFGDSGEFDLNNGNETFQTLSLDSRGRIIVAGHSIERFMA